MIFVVAALGVPLACGAGGQGDFLLGCRLEHTRICFCAIWAPLYSSLAVGGLCSFLFSSRGFPPDYCYTRGFRGMWRPLEGHWAEGRAEEWAHRRADGRGWKGGLADGLIGPADEPAGAQTGAVTPEKFLRTFQKVLKNFFKSS